MSNYFRVTIYHPQENICAIIDSHGYFEKLWELSSFMIKLGFEVLEVGNAERFLDVNFDKAEQSNKTLFLQACAKGKPEYICQTINGREHKAVRIDGETLKDRIYIPNKEQ